jgi:hypothetical protein
VAQALLPVRFMQSQLRRRGRTQFTKLRSEPFARAQDKESLCYSRARSPALATCSSSCDLAPETPTAPTHSP